MRRAEVLCSSQAGGGSLVPAAVQPRFRLVVAAQGAPGPGVPAGCGRGSSSPARAEAAPAGAGHEWRRESRVGERDERSGCAWGSRAWGSWVRATGAVCSFRWAVTGPYPIKYVSNLRFSGPIRPSSRIRLGYVSATYPCRIRIGYAIQLLTHVSVF